MYSIDRSFQRDFTRSDSTLFPAFIIILYAADFNYLIRWVIVNYILLTISIANSHATSAYECELLAVTWHYLPSADASTTWQVIRLSRRARDRGNGAYITALLAPLVNTAFVFFKRSKLAAAVLQRCLKQKHLLGNISWCMQMTFDSTSISLRRVYFSIGKFCEGCFVGRAID